MKKRTTAYVLLAVLVALVSGCATSGMEATGKPMGDPEYAKHLVIHNEPLAGKIIITEMNTRTTGGLLEVSVVLENLSSSDKQIQYRFSWYGDDNFEIEQGGEPWTPLTLHGRATAQMKAVAPNASVTTYKINVREI